ncbi:hypothetical protein HYPGJ_10408 [Hyphomicrobium sp. GJ21]|nr:hypothetical protein HYPGJ_10408 [Hyphomicrobium sp. GJ21]
MTASCRPLGDDGVGVSNSQGGRSVAPMLPRFAKYYVRRMRFFPRFRLPRLGGRDMCGAGDTSRDVRVVISKTIKFVIN